MVGSLYTPELVYLVHNSLRACKHQNTQELQQIIMHEETKKEEYVIKQP
jgi:hypothetical protein